MKNDYYKYLPGRKPSLLSLNDYVLHDSIAGGRFMDMPIKKEKRFILQKF